MTEIRKETRFPEVNCVDLKPVTLSYPRIKELLGINEDKELLRKEKKWMQSIQPFKKGLTIFIVNKKRIKDP